MTLWSQLQAAEPKIVGRVRAAVILLAGVTGTQAQGIADALQWPGLAPWLVRAAVLAAAIAALLRAGDKTPDNVVTQDMLPSKPYQTPRQSGMALIRTLALMALAAAAISACAFIHKEFGSNVGSGVVDCAAAEVQPAEQALVGDLATIFATALSGNLPALLAQLEQDAVTQFGPLGLTALKCAAGVIASGYETMHGGVSDAGVTAASPEMRGLLLMQPQSPQEMVYLRAKDYAAKR